MVKAMATVPLSAQGFLSESSFFKKVEMLARGYLDERACKSSFVQIRREFGHHGVTIFNIGILQMGTYLPMPQSYAGWAIPPGCYGMSVAMGYTQKRQPVMVIETSTAFSRILF